MDGIKTRLRKAKEKTEKGFETTGVRTILKTGSKRRSMSPHTGSGRGRKLRKPSPDSTPPQTPPHVGDGVEDVGFLTGFIANSERRGRDPTVEKEDRVYIRHAGKLWAELP